MEVKKIVAIGLLTVLVTAADNVCRPKKFDKDSIVCVCDEDYCDSLDPRLPSDGEYLLVTSNKDGLRFSTSYDYIYQPRLDMNSQCMNLLYKRSAIFDVDRCNTSQTVMGFGGAFTDAVGMNLAKFTPKMQDVFYENLFSKSGLNYNMARTTIGHCDFSPYEYYYTSKDNDYNMSSWALRKEDEWRIPYIKRAMSMVDDLLLTANIWTVPEWMRDYDENGIKSHVIEEHWDSYCLYIMKYLEAYREQGIKFWSVGYANEPTVTVGAILFPAEAQMFTTWALNKLAIFAVKHFSPALKQRGFNNTKILFFDDARDILTNVLVKTFMDVDGIKDIFELVGLHSYSNDFISPSIVDEAHKKCPNVTFVSTELSAGQLDGGIHLGAWSTAEFYAKNYIEEMNHHSSAWIDWNFALHISGQPRYTGAPVDAPIIIDHDGKVFYKQPSYYAIGHLSKFIPRGSQKISIKSEFATDIQATAALRPDGLVAACFLNRNDYSVDVTIRDSKGEITLEISPNSINTVVY